MKQRFIFLLFTQLYLISAVCAQSKLDSVKNIINSLEKTEKLITLNYIGYEYINSNTEYDIDSSKKYSSQALKLSRSLKSKFEESKAQRTLGIIMLDEQKYDSSLFYLNSALQNISEIDSLDLKFSIYSAIATNYYFLGDFQNTLNYLTEQLNIAYELNNKEDITMCLNRLGIIHKNMDQYEDAIYYYQEALKIAEEENDSLNIANTLNNIGNIYFHNRGNYVRALEYYSRALDISINTGNKENEAYLLRNLGNIYELQNKYQSALNNFNQALLIFKTLEKKENEIAITQSHISVIYARLGNFENALEFIQNSISYYTSIRAKPKIAETRKTQGDIYLEWGKYDLALYAYFKSYDITTELGIKSDLAELYHKISETYAKLNDYKKAFEYHTLSTDLNDSLFSEKVNRQIAEFQTLYETEKKDKEIALLNKDKALQDAAIKKQRLAIMFFIGGLAVVTIFMILILRLYRQKQKANKVLEQKNEEISLQRDQILLQKQEITDSIKYASKIQTALLPPQELIDKLIPDSFILFKPRDIVSGDFYWLGKKGNKIVSVTADCTGHGVPGAFMSMLGISFLNEIINITDEADLQSNLVLNNMRDLIITSLRQTGSVGESQDGMDMTLCIINKEEMTLDYAGAFNPLYLLRNGEIIEIKADKMPIGIHIKTADNFTNHNIKLQSGDIIYTFSDGYVDQFGGKENTKFRRKNFKNLLIEIHAKDMKKQKEILNKTLEEWMKGYNQVDDILVSGIKI